MILALKQVIPPNQIKLPMESPSERELLPWPPWPIKIASSDVSLPLCFATPGTNSPEMLGATTVGGAKVAKGASVGRLGVATFATVGSGGGSSVRVGIKVAVDEAVSAVGVAAIPSVTTAVVIDDEDGVAAAGVEALEAGGIVGPMVSEGVSDAAGLAGLDV